VHLDASAAPNKSRVVPGADRIEPECEGSFEHSCELDAFVATQARVRRAAGGIFGQKVVDYVFFEPLGEIPHVISDAQHVGHPTRVSRVFQAATAART
jgi:hypothetical protein